MQITLTNSLVVLFFFPLFFAEEVMKWTVPKWEKKQKRLQRNSGLLLGTGVIIVAG